MADRSLEQELIESFTLHISQSIDRYCTDNDYNTTQAANSLDIKMGTMRQWRNDGGLPKWSRYFELMLKLEGEASDDDRIELLSINLSDYFSKSIRAFCTVTDTYLKDFAKDNGISETSIYSWVNREDMLPRPKELMSVLAIVYDGRASASEVLRPIKRPEFLESAGYYLIVQDAFKPTDVSEHVPVLGDDMAYLVALLGGQSPRSTDEYAALMVATLQKLGDVVHYFRAAAPEERTKLRAICGDSYVQLAMIATEARQLLRKEENYQNYLKMNELDEDGKKW